MTVGRIEAFDLAEDARRLATLLRDYEVAHPEVAPSQERSGARCGGLSFAVDQATRLASGLTDWIEGRWHLTEKELEVFVANKTFNILAAVEDCGIHLGADDLLKEAWAAMLQVSYNPADAELAELILSSGKTFDKLARELHPAWSRRMARKVQQRGGRD